VDEEMNGGGGERRCAGMGEEPTDSNTEGTVAGTMEAGRQLKKNPCRRDAADAGAGAGAALIYLPLPKPLALRWRWRWRWRWRYAGWRWPDAADIGVDECVPTGLNPAARFIKAK
jgi:hypothetical protein